MFTIRTAIYTSIVMTLLILSLLGCSSQNKQPIEHSHQDHIQQSEQNNNQQANVHKPPVNDHPIDKDSHKQPSNEDVEAQHNPSPDQQDEQGQSNQSDNDSTSNQQQTPGEAPVKQPEAPVYNPTQPMLMGLMIGQSKALITEIYGTPLEEYVMEDPSDPITVYAYDGFIVGYNKLKLIEFIDVNAREVDSGLNGLRLYDSLEDAVKALGNPDTRTPYVLNYYSKDAVLKLDLDPLTNVITSIKLFGNNN